MRRIDAIVFDLDGTLLDTLATIGGAFNAALTQMGRAPLEIAAYRQIIGDGALVAAERCLPGGSGPETEELLARYREIYADTWQVGTLPYPGITALLEHFRDQVPLAVLSNKDAAFTRQCVTHFLGADTFAASFGFGDGVKHKPHPSGIERISQVTGIEPAHMMMVGDTATDMATAEVCGMLAVGVTWGFRDAAELEQSGAAHLVNNTNELAHIVTGYLEAAPD